MSTATLPAETPGHRLRLSGVDWRTYVTMSDLFMDRPVRFTYDRGELEIMTLSPEHERSHHLLSRMLDTLTEEMDIDIAGFGSMTFRREDLERGLEPDDCYWVQHEARVRGRDELDFNVDPPPDLVLEIEVTRNFIARLPICAALRVPEVWRYDGQTIHVLLLNETGEYIRSERSAAFPFLPAAQLVQFLAMNATLSETKVIQAFRAWVREQMARNWQ
jgi:Uma2 family endonuclease